MAPAELDITQWSYPPLSYTLREEAQGFGSEICQQS